MVKQGEIISIDLNPQRGHEQGGCRPALVISNDDFNKINNMTLICPITNSKPKTAFQFNLGEKTKTTGTVLCDQVRMIDVYSRHYKHIEFVPQSTLDEALDIMAGILEKI